MTIILTPEQEREFWAEARENSQQNLSEPFESYCQVLKQLGKGYTRSLVSFPSQCLLPEKSVWR
ncbi:hypothetical protein CDG77_09295 [Nostoc sp. 'Peltigera membranacea cyanobiont' 213]|uniref:hypothetical protein n=1 Tax=Nostoc sp. 'Peltigera membranacea cyanobiont' 213 TaxID=2014530 RepID=UPI000B959801|nr:hypothetical protein [Nostoc sp. 'Peltigera membranacea cyanobiont' 213]OYD96064.1 hypothetical protein CDG77_09295 [Nostoc sp. 'Peltigera membranacea cyanobiont' 213]